MKVMHDQFPGCPIEVPWELLKPNHEKQAERNHHQSLKRLHTRGGLSPSEFYCLLTGQRWTTVYGNEKLTLQKDYDAVNFLREFVGMNKLPTEPDDEVKKYWNRKTR